MIAPDNKTDKFPDNLFSNSNPPLKDSHSVFGIGKEFDFINSIQH